MKERRLQKHDWESPTRCRRHRSMEGGEGDPDRVRGTFCTAFPNTQDAISCLNNASVSTSTSGAENFGAVVRGIKTTACHLAASPFRSTVEVSESLRVSQGSRAIAITHTTPLHHVRLWLHQSLKSLIYLLVQVLINDCTNSQATYTLGKYCIKSKIKTFLIRNRTENKCYFFLRAN